MRKKDEVTEEPEIYEVSKNAKLQKYNAVMENTLIESRYNLTVEEQRLVLTTIATLDNAEKAPNGFPMLKIPKKLIIETTGIHEKNYHQIKNALRRLMQRVIEIETEKGFELYQWFAKAKYNKGENYIEVQFHPDLKPYLLELKKRFTKIPLKQVLQLRSKYAIRLYELLKRYESTGFRADYIKDLRKKLGIEEYEYPRFYDFERRALKPAIKEITEKTDIKVSYKKKKTGRKITHIEFEIKTKNKTKQRDSTEIKKSNSQNIDMQESKKVKKSNPDLWEGVLKILENSYNVDPRDIDTLREYTYASYKTDEKPKWLIIKTNVVVENAKQKIRNILNKHRDKINEIIKIETNGNYVPKLHMSILKEGKKGLF